MMIEKPLYEQIPGPKWFKVGICFIVIMAQMAITAGIIAAFALMFFSL